MALLPHSPSPSSPREQISCLRSWIGAALVAGLASGCSRSSAPPAPAATAATETPTSVVSTSASAPSAPADPRLRVDVLAFGRQLGQIAPCGCTSDPLGGLDFAFGYLNHESRPGQRAIVQPGSLLFPDPQGPYAVKEAAGWSQAEERAGLLRKSLLTLGEDLSAGVGPSDYQSPHGAKALERWPLLRILSNGKDLAKGIQPQQMRTLDNGLQIATLAAVDPAHGSKIAGLPPLLPVAPAIRSQIDALPSGVDLRILVLEGPLALAQAVVDAVPELDVVVVADIAHDADTGRLGKAPILRGKTWLLTPGEQAQTISHLQLALTPAIAQALQQANSDGLPSADAWQIVRSKSQNESAAARLRERLAKFRSDPQADRGFLANMERELAALEQGEALPSSAHGQPTVKIEQIKVSCRLPSDQQVKASLRDYDQWVSQANAKRFAGVFAPKAKRGTPSYVGMDRCNECHEEAVDFWKTTVHAKAYETLVTDNKQFDLACVNCHVTGFRKPGGSEVVENLKLRDVQCEQCHGPGSVHSDSQDSADISLHSPEPLCQECHTPEHSDTFQYQAYMRDILGVGHGEQAREKLGAGPTGHDLRSAALLKAGGACKKM